MGLTLLVLYLCVSCFAMGEAAAEARLCRDKRVGLPQRLVALLVAPLVVGPAAVYFGLLMAGVWVWTGWRAWRLRRASRAAEPAVEARPEDYWSRQEFMGPRWEVRMPPGGLATEQPAEAAIPQEDLYTLGYADRVAGRDARSDDAAYLRGREAAWSQRQQGWRDRAARGAPATDEAAYMVGWQERERLAVLQDEWRDRRELGWEDYINGAQPRLPADATYMAGRREAEAATPESRAAWQVERRNRRERGWSDYVNGVEPRQTDDPVYMEGWRDAAEEVEVLTTDASAPAEPAPPAVPTPSLYEQLLYEQGYAESVAGMPSTNSEPAYQSGRGSAWSRHEQGRCDSEGGWPARADDAAYMAGWHAGLGPGQWSPGLETEREVAQRARVIAASAAAARVVEYRNWRERGWSDYVNGVEPRYQDELAYMEGWREAEASDPAPQPPPRHGDGALRSPTEDLLYDRGYADCVAGRAAGSDNAWYLIGRRNAHEAWVAGALARRMGEEPATDDDAYMAGWRGAGELSDNPPQPATRAQFDAALQRLAAGNVAMQRLASQSQPPEVADGPLMPGVTGDRLDEATRAELVRTGLMDARQPPAELIARAQEALLRSQGIPAEIMTGAPALQPASQPLLADEARRLQALVDADAAREVALRQAVVAEPPQSLRASLELAARVWGPQAGDQPAAAPEPPAIVVKRHRSTG